VNSEATPAVDPLAESIRAVGSLDEPLRLRIYSLVAASPSEVDRDAVAAGVDISRKLAAFHLDRLAERGLLTVSYRRVSGRTGPGAGRPRKFYRRSNREVAVTLPPRDYELMARLFASALEAAGPRSRDVLVSAAKESGSRLGQGGVSASSRGRLSERRARAQVLNILAGRAYEPHTAERAIYMRNCPFHALSRQHPNVVCRANHALLEGLTETIESANLRATYEPADGRCCVVLRPQSGAVT
jgi:predicted ArsR family transcriptional regulator